MGVIEKGRVVLVEPEYGGEVTTYHEVVVGTGLEPRRFDAAILYGTDDEPVIDLYTTGTINLDVTRVRCLDKVYSSEELVDAAERGTGRGGLPMLTRQDIIKALDDFPDTPWEL